jgi:hypothetical protein
MENKETLKGIYERLKAELTKVPLSEMDKHIDRMVYIENKLKGEIKQ